MTEPFKPIDAELLAHATPAELEYYLKLLRAEQALQSPLDYAMYATPGAQAFAHTQYLNEVLVALTERRLYRSGPSDVPAVLVYRHERDKKGQWVHPETGEPALLRVGISLPPQVGKSYMVKHFCAQFMRTHPDENIMYITYASPLAEKISREIMKTIERTPELGNNLDPDRKSVKNWAIEGGMGEFMARGVTGSVTGFGGNVIFDDPHADGIAAASDSERGDVLTLWDSSVATRTGGGFKWAVVIQTRWHPDDLIGHLQETDFDSWFWVVLPAIAYETTDEEGYSVHPDFGFRDPLGRRPGESVCPELFAEEDFAAAKKRDPFWYDSEYQQLPYSLSASMFKRFNYYRLTNGVYEIFREDGTSEFVREEDCYRFAMMDLATSKKQSADYTVYGVFDITPSRLLLVREIVRPEERVSSDEHIPFLYKNAALYDVEWTGIEEKTYGLSLIQNAIAEGKTLIHKVTEKGDKKQRAIPAAMMFANDQLFIDVDAPWKADFEKEHRTFRGDDSGHDDQVDVTSYAAIYWSKTPVTPRKRQRRKPEEQQQGYGIARMRRKRKFDEHPEVGDF